MDGRYPGLAESISEPDLLPPYVTEADIISRVLTGATDGGVSLMHDLAGNVSATVAALDDVIIGLQSQGYEFVTMHGIKNIPVNWNDNGTLVTEPNAHYVQPHFDLTA